MNLLLRFSVSNSGIEVTPWMLNQRGDRVNKEYKEYWEYILTWEQMRKNLHKGPVRKKNRRTEKLQGYPLDIIHSR